MVKVQDIVRGNLVDLEFDPIADPDGEVVAYGYEYAEVVDVWFEEHDETGEEIVVIQFEDDAIGFPYNYELEVVVSE